MAFKATRKPVTKKATKDSPKEEKVTKHVKPSDDVPVEAQEASVPQAEVSPSLSIEDFVGAPVGDTPAPSLAPTPHEPKPAVTPSTDRGFDRAPRRDFAPSHSGGRGRGRFDRGGHGGSFGGHRQGGFTRDFHRGGGNGYNRDRDTYRRDDGFGRDPGFDRAPRRDFQDQGSTFTADVDVPTETVRGVLDIMPDGHGFLRPKYAPSERDVYISQSQIRRFLLRNGDMVEGQARPPKDNERYYGLLKVEKVDDLPAEQMEKRPRFEDLVPVYPNKLLKLETGEQPLSTRIIDLLAPIGFGQRGLIVSPPKAGKTTILKDLATGISINYPEVHLMAVLIGERPEEVTDLSRNVKGEVYASNFDESPEHQTRVAEVALDRAKR